MIKKINSISSNINHKFKFIFYLLSIMLLLAAFINTSVYAKSSNNMLMDQMKINFDHALNKGDAAKLKQIWESIDIKFSDKYQQLSARAIIYGGGPALNIKQYVKLYKEQPNKFEKVALFMSSINSNFMAKKTSDFSGSFSGTIKNKNKLKIKGAKVIIAGRKTTTNSKGYFLLTELPIGIYDAYILSPGYQLTLNPITSIKSNYKKNISFILNKSNYSPPEISQQQANLKIDNAMTKIANAITSDKPKGTEIIRGTLLDAESGAPIVGAKVIMVCQSTLNKTISDKNGYFSLDGIPTERCDFTVAYTNSATLDDLYTKAQTGTDISYAFSAQYKIVSKSNHIHENTWRIKPRHMKLDDKP